LLLLLVVSGMGFAADVCPQSEAATGRSQALDWKSYRGQVGRKHCIGNEVRNDSGEPLAVSWQEAGIDKVLVQDRVEVAVCCFDALKTQKATLQYGTPRHDLPVTMQMPAEEGAANHEEGYPDLIEGDARVRTVSIRGTLRAGDETVRVDLVLKCSASKFAKEFAYQFSIMDRSADPVEVDWDLLRNLRDNVATPSVQTIPNGKTYIFLMAAAPREAESLVKVKTKSGQVAGRFRFDGFTATTAH
jgi:hypothetical protein